MFKFCKIKQNYCFKIIFVFFLLFLLLNIVKIDDNYFWRFSTTVYIDNCSNNDAKILLHMPLIKKLSIRNCQSDDVDFLGNMPFLKEVYINSDNYYDWTPLNKCKQLTKFSGGRLTFDNMDCFSKMKKIETLDISTYFEMNIYSLDGLDKITSLKRLSLSSLGENVDVHIVNSLANLEYLEIIHSDIDTIEINMNQLTYLNISYNANLENISIGDNCNQLETLLICYSPNINVDILELSQLPSLKMVYVSNGQFNNKDILLLESKGINVIII